MVYSVTKVFGPYQDMNVLSNDINLWAYTNNIEIITITIQGDLVQSRDKMSNLIALVVYNTAKPGKDKIH